MRETPLSNPVRLDRWLWAARFFRSRSAATQACGGGKVEVNDRVSKPHKLVRPGDLVELTVAFGKRRLKVVGTSEKRGPAKVACTLYEDLTPPTPRGPRAVVRDRGGGRPSKRDRRRTDRLRGW